MESTQLYLSSDGGNIGIGFAIPINMVKSIVKQLMTYGKVHRGLMGILVQTLTPDLADAFHIPHKKGAIISQILQGSPAQKAGLRTGDVITEINNQPVKSSGDVHNIISLLRAGSFAKLVVFRGQKTIAFFSTN